jgi:hypothetical protein
MVCADHFLRYTEDSKHSTKVLFRKARFRVDDGSNDRVSLLNRSPDGLNGAEAQSSELLSF